MDEKNKGRTARKEIDKKQFEKLCAIHCSPRELKAMFDCSDETLNRWCKETYGMTLGETIEQKSGMGKVSLRRQGFEMAFKNPAVHIFYAKNHLGMSDNPDKNAQTQIDVPWPGLPARVLGKAYVDINRDIDNRKYTYYDFKGGRGCHAKGTPILLADGTTKLAEDIEVGDYLLGKDGEKRKVIELHRGREAGYKITPTRTKINREENSFIVNASHILHLEHVSGKTMNIPVWDAYYRWKDGIRRGKKRDKYYLRYSQAVEFDRLPVDYIIPPQLIGLLLGDGCFRSSSITITTNDQETINYCLECCMNLGLELVISSKQNTDAVTCRFSTKTRKNNILLNEVKRLDLKDTSSKDKFIPDQYKYGSIQDRKALLAGLIDSDGSNNGGDYDIASKSERLANDIKFVANSLGFKATICSRLNLKYDTVYYTVTIVGDMNDLPILTERKKYIGNPNKRAYSSGAIIEPVGDIDYFGWTIDGDHLYLDGNFLVHHNSLKSSFCALKMIDLLMTHKNMCGFACREVKDTLKDSVYAQLIWAIDELGLSDEWKAVKNPLEIRNRKTDQHIYFRGANDPMKIKSLRTPNGMYIGVVWAEEADQLSPESWRNILQSVMRGGNDTVVFRSYNTPISVSHFINQEALVNNPKRLIHESSFLDAPREWLGNPFFEMADFLKYVNERAYQHEYLGLAVGTGANVFENVTIEHISEHDRQTFDNLYYGIDWGFANDPDVVLGMHYNKRQHKLYIMHEYFATGSSFDKTAEAAKIINPSNFYMTADSEEPRSINELNQRGLRVVGAKKGPGSVDHGIRWLQGLNEIIIDPVTCPNATREFTQYEYARDKFNNIISAYPDKDNHCVDCCRYALEAEIKNSRFQKSTLKLY